MGWLERCYETYEKNLREVGKSSYRGEREAPVLLPVAHITQKAQIEVNLSYAGEFRSARVLRKDEETTVIPCTEESGSRTSGPKPHPLADKLQYITEEYERYGGSKPSMFNEYVFQLEAWCESEYGNDILQAVLTYIKKGTIIFDLVNFGVLVLGENGKLVSSLKDYQGEKPQIAQLLDDETECFIRWSVGGIPLHENEDIWRSWIDYYVSTIDEVGTCFVTGQKMSLSRLSPGKIRNAADKAKLISSNDSTNFTFRGERFDDSKQALRIGYEATQKAHSALRWLVGKQAIYNDGQVTLVWGTENETIPPIIDDSFAFVGEDDLSEEIEKVEQNLVDTTRVAFARCFNRAVLGYKYKLGEHSKISVMILDAATSGRLSVKYYRELSGSQLIESVQDWHETFAWWHDYHWIKSEKDGRTKSKRIQFCGVPSPSDIAKAAYGENVDAKLVNRTIERLLPCITERKNLPHDIMLSVVQRASNAVAYKDNEAQKVRSIACSLVRGYHNRNLKEDYTMALQEDSTNRSYVFGRILACADYLEYCAENIRTGDRRPTNAQRLESAFTQRPAKYCKELKRQLTPYITRLMKNGKSIYPYSKMLELIASISPEDYTNKPLDELYLLGYATQRQEFFTSKKDNVIYSDDNTDEIQEEY